MTSMLQLLSIMCWAVLIAALPDAATLSSLMEDEFLLSPPLDSAHGAGSASDDDSSEKRTAEHPMTANANQTLVSSRKPPLRRSKCGSDDPAPEIPRFLFAGQSNCEGNSNDALSGLFETTIDIVNEKFQYPWPKSKTKRKQLAKRIKRKLREAINMAKDAEDGSTINEANLIYNMAGDIRRKASSILNNETILEPHPNIVCSFSNPLQNEIDCESPVSPTSCGAGGEDYGPELMFAHHFPKLNTKYKNIPHGITKVSPSGSIIDEFLKGSGSERNFWGCLRANIHADNGSIEAFFWFQGENGIFKRNPTQKVYFKKLKRLVKFVRREIFIAHRARWGKRGSPTARFSNRNDIPVVIFELGSWIGNYVNKGGPGNIIMAQRQYVKSDPNSILVYTGTNDNEYKRYSHHYHFDDPSQLLIGRNMAEAFKKLLDKNG